VTGDKGRLAAERREQAIRRHARRQNSRLCVLGELEAIVGTLEAQTRQPLAQRPVGLVESLAADGKRVGQGLAHSDLLRSLPGKEQRDQG
jgi:hypothetical protein